MKSIFKIRHGLATVAAVAALAAGCSRPPQALVPAPPDGGDAQRLVTVLDYVSSDYARAVQGGTVVSPAEYEEQVKFVADAQALVASVLRPAPAGRSAGHRGGARGGGGAGQGRPRRGGPGLPGGEGGGGHALRPAHGADGDAVARPRADALRAVLPPLPRRHGRRATRRRPRPLDPRPASFREPARLAALSPYRVYNTLTFGVPGTGMASFESLSPSDRWALAFYVLRLGHEGEPARGPAAP